MNRGVRILHARAVCECRVCAVSNFFFGMCRVVLEKAFLNNFGWVVQFYQAGVSCRGKKFLNNAGGVVPDRLVVVQSVARPVVR